MQTRRHSIIESLANMIVGLLVSFLVQLWIYPFLGIPVSLYQNLFITAIFFITSFLRAYILRRIFNSIK